MQEKTYAEFAQQTPWHRSHSISSWIAAFPSSTLNNQELISFLQELQNYHYEFDEKNSWKFLYKQVYPFVYELQNPPLYGSRYYNMPYKHLFHQRDKLVLRLSDRKLVALSQVEEQKQPNYKTASHEAYVEQVKYLHDSWMAGPKSSSSEMNKYMDKIIQLISYMEPKRRSKTLWTLSFVKIPALLAATQNLQPYEHAYFNESAGSTYVQLQNISKQRFINLITSEQPMIQLSINEASQTFDAQHLLTSLKRNAFKSEIEKVVQLIAECSKLPIAPEDSHLIQFTVSETLPEMIQMLNNPAAEQTVRAVEQQNISEQLIFLTKGLKASADRGYQQILKDIEVQTVFLEEVTERNQEVKLQ